MNSRCLHEMKTSGAEQAAEKMELTLDVDTSIRVTDLGQSVLTLSEAVQLFEVESHMYNIKNDLGYRSVVMRKANVEIDGKKKEIIMIRDVTDQVKLE